MNLLVDTSALYAVLDRDDANHPTAREIWMRLLSGSDRLKTTNYIVVETSALVQHRLGMPAMRTFLDEVIPAIEVEWITPSDHQAAVAALLAADRRRLSLVDCSSFTVMRRLGLHHAFAFDRHFAEQGFEMIQ